MKMMIRPSLLLLLASAAVLLGCFCNCNASMIVSESRARLPMSLSTVISDLEAEGMQELSTACVIVSRSVTAAQKQTVMDAMMGGPDEHLSASSSKAVATVKGLALALPSHALLEEVVQSTVACQGLVIFVPSTSDLRRGEGVMDALAPAMERLLQWQASQQAALSESYENKACLVVVCEPGQEDATKKQLQTAAAPILKTFSTTSGKKVQQIEDVFDGSVLYLTADKVEAALLNHQQRPQQTVTPEDAMTLVASVVAEDGSLFAPLTALASTTTTEKIRTSPNELAAARQLEPLKRQAVQAALTLVGEATASNTKLVPTFGALCDAVLQQAKDQFVAASSSSTSSYVEKDLAFGLKQELASELYDVYEAQLQLLSESSFASFQQGLSKLRLGPTLASDMEQVAQDALSQFASTVKQLVPRQLPMASGVWKGRATDTQTALGRRLKEFCKDRLQAAEASGQFRPVPRKGVTIGMHWLLPKPFGNDYRQEPWMVHATDNMVYVPRRATKVTDVPHEDVLKTGDWRDQIVPSPAGKDMLFMQ